MSEEKTLIGDYGEVLHGMPRFIAILAILFISLIMGVFIGLFVQIMLQMMNLGIHLVWSVLPRNTDVWWLPLAICPTGGVAIGLWNRHFNAAPEPLTQVMAQVKREGVYHVKNVPAGIVAFLLPLAFGGSVGPEAGLTGFIASGATGISASLRRAGLRVRSLADVTVSATICAVFGAPFAGLVAATENLPGSSPDEQRFTYRRIVKVILYGIAAAGAFGGIWLVSLVLGSAGGLPRFASIEMPLYDAVWIFVCIAAGYLLALAFGGANLGAASLGRKLKGHDIAMGLIAGVALGVLGMLFPYVLFSGEEQSREIFEIWQTIPAGILIITAVTKVAMTPLCIEMGWRGGEIFPCIFSGVALGLGIAGFAGIDPVFCTACTCGAFMGAKLRKPVLAATLLLLCFPFNSVIWLVIAAFAASFIPQPKSICNQR
jgi:H+/Cl- antiporter ClcA